MAWAGNSAHGNAGARTNTHEHAYAQTCLLECGISLVGMLGIQDLMVFGCDGTHMDEHRHTWTHMDTHGHIENKKPKNKTEAQKHRHTDTETQKHMDTCEKQKQNRIIET